MTIPHPEAAVDPNSAVAGSHPLRVTIATPDGDLPAYLWRPPTGTGPGLVLVQEIFGVSDYIQDRAADLAALGYVVLVPEVYWRLPDATIDSAGDALGQALALVQQLDWDKAVADVGATVEHLRGLIEVTGPVGLVGFCFGGGLAFAVAAERPVDALVSYYGSALPDLLGLADRVTVPSLHHFGTADSYIPPERQQEIRAAVTGNGARFESYEGAGHAFDNPHPMFHHADAAASAWTTTVRFLAEHLQARG